MYVSMYQSIAHTLGEHLSLEIGYLHTEYFHASSSFISCTDFSIPLCLALFGSLFEIYICMAGCVFESIQIYISVLNKFAI